MPHGQMLNKEAATCFATVAAACHTVITVNSNKQHLPNVHPTHSDDACHQQQSAAEGYLVA